jgi:signal transduction histidine kinase
MRPERASRLATTLWLVGVVALVGSLVFAAVDHHPFELASISEGFAFAAIGVVGWVLARRRPENPIGWLYLAVWLGVGVAFSGFQEYAVWATRHDGPFLDLVTWLSNWLWVPIFGLLLTYPFLLFPDGQLLSRRWRIVGWAAGIVLTLWSVAFAFETQDFTDALGHPAANPYAIAGTAAFFNAARVVLAFVLLGVAGACVASLFVRFRRARGDEREQIKWLMTSGALLIVWLALPLEHGTGGPADTIQGFFLALIPISVGIAILKYRLYDIDVVIRKTVVYAILAVFITVVYVGIVVGIGSAVGRGDGSNVALQIAATATVAIAFQFVRERANRFANRLVYGKRATPYETLTRFSERVGGTYATEDVLARIAHVIADGIAAGRVDVWLRVGSELRPAASWPDAASQPEALPMVRDELPSIAAQRSAPVLLNEELLGAISADKPASEPFTPAEERLLEDLASQAGLVLANVRMTAELEADLERIAAQADELRASRQRIVAAQDEERRRLERNIHDGAQQHLVALAVKLRLARATIAKDPAKAREMLVALQGEIDEALETLTSLALGIYPPLLEEQGLAPALAAQYTRSDLPVHLSTDGIRRYPIEIEGAVYFCVLEALQNAAKYSRASRIDVRLWERDDELGFEVADDGVGFDSTTHGNGTGLQGMRDRLAVFGGDATIHSRPGGGTSASGRIPLATTAAMSA